MQQRSGLGELIGYDYEAMGLERLYQASDMLWQHREALQAHLYGEEHSLFGFEGTVTLYDLTNTLKVPPAPIPKQRMGAPRKSVMTAH